jgi:hypothetical protein
MPQRPEPSARAQYGFDAPGIMLGLSLGGGSGVLLGCLIAAFWSRCWGRRRCSSAC